MSYNNPTPYDIQYIASECGNALRSNGSWNCSCPVPSHGKGRGDKNPSLSLSEGRKGEFLAKCHAGCTFEDITGTLKSLRLLPDHFTTPRSSPVQITGKNPSLKEQQEKILKEKKLKQALSLWGHSVDATGTLVDSYFSSRSLTITPPETLRFHHKLEYWEQTEEGKPNLVGHFPAMVALVQRYPGDECVGIHRTYLKSDGSGKADVPSPKKMLGSCLGGAVRFPGESLECIAVGEGIESCLSYSEFNPLMTVWAALTSGGLERVILPDSTITKEVIVLVDNDLAGRKAYEKLAERLTQVGHKVYKLIPPGVGNDLNDLLGKRNNV